MTSMISVFPYQEGLEFSVKRLDEETHIMQIGFMPCEVKAFCTLDQVVEMRDKLTDYINTQAQTSEVAA